MIEPADETDDAGSGGSSDGDTQPDDSGAAGTIGDHTTGDEKAAANREDDPPA